MLKKMTMKQICMGAAVAAVYVVLTIVCGPLAFGPIQFRPAEALTILPLLFPEAIPGLFIGCLLANIVSPYGVWDIMIGSAVTLIAAIVTRYSKNVWLGGIAPVILNAAALPLMWLLMGSDTGYFLNFGTIFLTEAIFVYALGVPLYYGMKKLKPKIYGMKSTAGNKPK